jgi:hypothetical protein
VTTPDQPEEMGLGGKLAARIAETVVRASLSATAQSGPHKASVAQSVLAEFTNHVSDEIRGVLGPLWSQFAQDENTPEHFRGVFQALASERGQAWAWIGGAVGSTGIAGGLSGVFEAYLAPLVHLTNAALTPAILSPADTARAVTIGRTAGLNPEREMAANGFDADRTAILYALSQTPPAADVVIELLRRNEILSGEARDLLRRNGYEDHDVSRILKLTEQHLSPADAAAAWARNSMTAEQTDHLGAIAGLAPDDMRVLRDLAGQPPSPEELLFAWRRGIITEADVDRGIIQGPIRNEWIPVVKALQWLPLGVAEAADAVNQGHMTVEAATEVAKLNGVKPEDFAIYVANSGIPPGPQEALDWVNRGLLTEDEFRTAFLESRIKNKYIDLYLKTRYVVMPPETIRLMYSRGALTKEEALKRLQERGYTPDDAAIVIDGASAEKTQPSRDLTVAQVLELRADGLISDTDALAMLEAAGYDPDEALWVTQLADLRRVSTFVRAAISRTKASYVAGRLDEINAGAVLDQLGLPADYKENTFALWDLERTTVTKGLTPSQIVSAVKKEFISVDDGLARLQGQGYALEDAQVLLLIGGAVEGV